MLGKVFAASSFKLFKGKVMESINIKKMLHQRGPYLMVSEVLSIDPISIYTRKVHNGEEAHLKGHFPGAPVVPGAMLQEICTQSAGVFLTKYFSPIENYDSNLTKGHALGVLNKVNYAKYLAIVKPDHPIEAKIQLIHQEGPLFKFRGKVFQKDVLKAKLSFNLMNISDELLR